MTLWKLFHFYESQVTHLWNENINTYFTRFFWGHSETKHQGSWQSCGCLSWCVWSMAALMPDGLNIMYVNKFQACGCLHVCPFIPADLSLLSEICRTASEHSLGWRAATTTKIEGAEANRRPGSIWTPVPESGEGLREAPSSQTVCVSLEMLLF